MVNRVHGGRGQRQLRLPRAVREKIPMSVCERLHLAPPASEVSLGRRLLRREVCVAVLVNPCGQNREEHADERDTGHDGPAD